MSHRKKIALLYCGGLSNTVQSQGSLQRELAIYDELVMLADVRSFYIPGEHRRMEETQLQRAALQLEDLWDQFDGFVILMAYDQFVYEADLLSYMIGEVGKPVVCTTIDPASFDENNEIDSVARSQFISSIQAATGELGGCMIILGSAMMPASHVVIEEGRKTRLVSADDIIYGVINFGVQLTEHAPAFTGFPPELQLEYEQRVQFVHALDEGQQITTPSILSHIESLSVEQLEKIILAPALVIQEDSIALIEDSQIYEVTGLTECSAAAKFTWILGQMQRVNLTQREKARSLYEWMQFPMLNEFLTPAT